MEPGTTRWHDPADRRLITPRRLSIALLGLLLVHLFPTAAHAHFFLELGDLLGNLPGSSSRSVAFNISADGSTVVGASKSPASGNGYEPFRWTAATGMVGLGAVPGSSTSGAAAAVSADGSEIVGRARAAPSNTELPFRWTESEGMVSLGTAPGAVEDGSAHDVSADGTVVTGLLVANFIFGGTRAFRWTASGGMVLLDVEMFGIFFGSGDVVSADGTFIVGVEHSQFVRWPDGMPKVLLGEGGGEVHGMTSDGSTIVGGKSFEAFRWTESSGLVSLGDLPGGAVQSTAYDVSADGSVIVGVGESEAGDEAFIWDPVNGMRALGEVLSERGIATNGWLLEGAFGISDDGLRIVGSGINPSGDRQAWLADLSPPDPGVPTLAPLGTALVAALLAVAGRRCVSSWRARRPGAARLSRNQQEVSR